MSVEPASSENINPYQTPGGAAEGVHAAPAKGATRGSLVVIFLTVMVDLLGFAIVLPLLPIYARKFGVGEDGMVLGLLMASFSIMQFLFAPVWGWTSDRIGRRPVLLVGLAAAAFFYFLFGIATTMHSLTLIFVARIGAGIACATIPTAQAYIADSTTLENRGKGMALIGAAFGIGFCFGPLLGAVTLLFGDPEVESPWPGYAAAILSSIALGLAWFKLPESLTVSNRDSKLKIFDFQAFTEALTVPTIGMLLLTSFMSLLSFGGFEMTLSLLLKDESLGFKFRYADVLLFFAYIGLVLTITQGLIVRRFTSRVGEAKMAVTGAVLSFVGFIAIAMASQSNSVPFLMVATGLEVGGFACITPSILSLISRRSDPARQGSISGVAQSVSALARIAGPIVAIPLFKRGATLPYWTSAGLMLFALAIMLVAVRGGRDYGKESNLPPVGH
jgi:DHA1 family tetracycline resistance protein-like MFS transporter